MGAVNYSWPIRAQVKSETFNYHVQWSLSPEPAEVGMKWNETGIRSDLMELQDIHLVSKELEMPMCLVIGVL
jgi:hypothetical protein